MSIQTRGLGKPRILLIQDDSVLVELLSIALGREGYDVVNVLEKEGAYEAANSLCPDVIVLDLVLHEIDGLPAMRRVRTQLPTVPVLVLTACDSLDDWLAAVQAGAEEYLTKPFSPEVLIDRLQGLLPPSSVPAHPRGILAIGDLCLDERSRQVYRGSDLIELDGTAFDVLRFLMRRAGRLMSGEQSLEAVWNFDVGGGASVVDRYVAYLRGRIEDGSTAAIRTMLDVR